MITQSKSLRFSGLKVSPSKPDDAQVSVINKFTRRKFSADELYIGQIRLAHNAIDRDNERFSNEVLDRFAQTIVRKSMLFDHAKYDSRSSAVGKFFAAQIETIPIDQAREVLGEDLVMPAGETEVRILAPWFYIPIKGVSEETITKIDAGIYDFASIGFRAELLMPVRDTQGNILYGEYRGNGHTTEATEGSLVFLGAQGGMGIKTNKTSSGMESGAQITTNPEGEKVMDKLLAKLSKLYDKNFTEDNTVENIKALLDMKDAKIKEYEEKTKTVKALEDRIKEIEPLAADGKAYRDGLITDYITLKAKLGEVAETPEAQKNLREVVKQYPIDFLKTEAGHLQKRVETAYPCEGQLKGDMRRDKSAGADEQNKSFIEPD